MDMGDDVVDIRPSTERRGRRATAKKKAVCAGNADMKPCVVMYRWKVARFLAVTSFRIA